MQIIQAFGFETKEFVSTMIEKQSKDFVSKKKIPETFVQITLDVLKNSCFNNFKIANTTKIFGYFPIIGIIIGINRIYNSIMKQSERKENPDLHPEKIKLILRGTIEFFNLGFLLIIPDLIVTFFRPGNVEFGNIFCTSY